MNFGTAQRLGAGATIYCQTPAESLNGEKPARRIRTGDDSEWGGGESEAREKKNGQIKSGRVEENADCRPCGGDRGNLVGRSGRRGKKIKGREEWGNGRRR